VILLIATWMFTLTVSWSCCFGLIQPYVLGQQDLFRRSGLPHFDLRILVGWLLHNAWHNQWFPVAAPYRSKQITVHLSDELKRYFFWAHGFALAMIRATAEVFVRHRDHHAEGPLVALGLTLRKRVEVGNFSGSEKHGGGIRARGDTCTTADACSHEGKNLKGVESNARIGRKDSKCA
jgi:hypothetical protein